MNVRVLQVVLCAMIWSILIGIGLFKLSPIAGSVSTPLVPQLVASDDNESESNNSFHSLRRTSNTRESRMEQKERESKRLITQKLTNMIWDTAGDSYVPSYSRNRNVGRDYSRTQKRLVVAGAAKQKKIKQLMALLNELSNTGEVGIQQVVRLIDLELVIIKNLLNRNNARIIQSAVDKRDALLEISLPAAAEVYDMTLSLATESDKKSEPSARAPFLRSMMERLEQYYLLIKNMQNTFKTVNR